MLPYREFLPVRYKEHFWHITRPVYSTELSVGADLKAYEKITIKAHDFGMVPLGVKAHFNEDEMLNIYPRSSFAKKTGLILANGVGVVEADYWENESNDGELCACFYNLKDEDVEINPGDKVCQAVIVPILRAQNGVEILNEKRTGGFGSTDKLPLPKLPGT